MLTIAALSFIASLLSDEHDTFLFAIALSFVILSAIIAGWMFL